MNPFFTTYEYIPFDRIKFEDYEPAIMRGIEEEDKDIESIVSNRDKATFENTIEALDNAGSLLENVEECFYNLLSAETNDNLDNLAQKLSPILSEHSNNILLNQKLFERVKSVYNEYKSKNFDGLTTEQKTLLEKKYSGFVRNGALLTDEEKTKLRDYSSQLSVLSLQFSQNKLKETNDFFLHITDENDLEGLPDSSKEAAREAAKERNLDGWCITLHAPSMVPFMTYSTKRTLREKVYMAYNTICTHDNDNNNYEIVRSIVNLSLKLANLLGYKNYAEYVLENRMAENTTRVYSLLDNLIDAYMPTARKEVDDVRSIAKEIEGEDFVMMPWDFAYYSNKLKEREYNINSEMVRPYFELSKVKEGVFGLATELYGIKFTKNDNVPVYHKDVEVYDVIDKDNKPLATFYCDFHPRSSKKSGAWMTNFKSEYIDKNGKRILPQVSIVTNFTKPTPDKPALLTLDEVETFLHEFGHSLHGIFANTKYRSLSGTNVYWDFVELPSQFMENFSVERDFLITFARHYKTGEVIPDELIKKIIDSRNFNVAYACMRQVSFGLLDMAYYTITEPLEEDIRTFEKKAWEKAQVINSVNETCMSVQFSHIMAGGYSAGYYSYKWAEVLDADAFSLFKKNGIFNKETADSFRNNILSKGGTEHPMKLYVSFRGQEPTIDALLKRNGIIQ